MEPYQVGILSKPYDMHDASKIVMEKMKERQDEAGAATAGKPATNGHIPP